MHLSVSQKKLNEEIGDEYRREQLTAKIRDTENLISESEKKIAAKEISMYVHCRQEEKGTSRDTSNYVYRIKHTTHANIFRLPLSAHLSLFVIQSTENR